MTLEFPNEIGGERFERSRSYGTGSPGGLGGLSGPLGERALLLKGELECSAPERVSAAGAALAAIVLNEDSSHSEGERFEALSVVAAGARARRELPAELVAAIAQAARGGEQFRGMDRLAIRALTGVLGAPAEETLLDILKNPDEEPARRAQAADALRPACSEQALRGRIAILRDPHSYGVGDDLLRKVIFSFSGVRRDMESQAALAEIVRGSHDETHENRVAALSVLGRVKDNQIVDMLSPLLDSMPPGSGLRMQLLDSLRSATSQPLVDRLCVIARKSASTPEEREERERAIQRLSGSDLPAAIETLAHVLLVSRDERILLVALRSCKGRSNPAIVAATRLLAQSGDPAVQLSAVDNLGVIRNEDSELTLTQIADHERAAPTLRKAALEALAVLDTASSRRFLSEVALRYAGCPDNSDESALALSAMRGLGRLREAEPAQPFVELIALERSAVMHLFPSGKRYALDISAPVREAAIELLACNPDVCAESALLDLIEGAPDPAHRIKAVSAIDPGNPGTRRRLLEILRGDHDPAIHQAIWRRLETRPLRGMTFGDR